jgi:glycosyltransferase involved in cell wall biosynthesis
MLKEFHADRRRTTTIENYCDFDEFKALSDVSVRTSEISRSSPIRCVNVGRLHPQKNQDFLVSLCAFMKSINLDIKLTVLGDGPLRDELERLAIQKGLSISRDANEGADVCFVGSRPNVFEHLCNADLFLFPSRYEGFPNAIMEAMYAGIPIIASDCQTGPAELLKCTDNAGARPAGFLLPIPDAKCPEDLSRWASAITKIHSDPRLKKDMIEAAQTRIYGLSPQKIRNRWVEEIEKSACNFAGKSRANKTFNRGIS